MKKVLVVAVGALLISAGQASAGVFSDDLAKCLVAKTSPTDRAVFMRWMFTLISSSPSVTSLSSVTPAQREDVDRGAAGLMERLMLQDCRTETVTAIRNEGMTAVESGFQTLGQVAARDLMSDPAVTARTAAFTKYLDKSRWDALGKDAGAPKQ